MGNWVGERQACLNLEGIGGDISCNASKGGKGIGNHHSSRVVYTRGQAQILGRRGKGLLCHTKTDCCLCFREEGSVDLGPKPHAPKERMSSQKLYRSSRYFDQKFTFERGEGRGRPLFSAGGVEKGQKGIEVLPWGR